MYIDEGQEYFNDELGSFFEQARKANISVSIAHQGLYQLPRELAGALSNNASTKMAAGLPPDEEAAMARQMRCRPQDLRRPIGTFFAFVKGEGAVPIAIPENYLEKWNRRANPEIEEVRNHSRQRFCSPEAPDLPTTPTHTDHDDNW